MATSTALGYNPQNFSVGSGVNDYVWAIASQSDGKILVGGDFTTYSGVTANKLVRLNIDGSIDTTFNIGTGFDSRVWDIQVLPDQKILVAGSFTTFSGISQNRLIRLNTNGSKDTTFEIGSGFSGSTDIAISLKVLSDGKILVGGQFTSYSGYTANRLIRLNSDGSIDTTLDIGTGFNTTVLKVDIQAGKILVGGQFSYYKGSIQAYLIRLNTDGSVDTSFPTGSSLFNGSVNNFVVDPITNEIFVGGTFTVSFATSRNRLTKLNSNGTLNSSFNVGTGFNAGVRSLSFIPAFNKLVVAGDFTTYQSLSQNYVIRLNSDGSKDTTFDIGTGPNDFVTLASVQGTSNCFLGGAATSYNGVSLIRLQRIGYFGAIASGQTLISGTEQIGTLAVVSATTANPSLDPQGVKFWMGPDEELGYIVGLPVPPGNQPTPITGLTAYLGFIRSSALTETSFLQMVNPTFNQNFTSGASAKTWLNSNGYWTTYNLPTSFISTWDSTIAGASGVGKVALPLESTGTYAFGVDWGDGTSSYITAYNQAEVTHTYTTPSTSHVITIVGTIIGFTFNNGGDKLKIKSVTRWGSLRLGNSGGYFYGCQNLSLSSVVDVLNLQGTTSLSLMFESCYSISTVNRMDEWDVSSVTHMGQMFQNAANFDQNLNNWNVGNVTIMYFMFNNCKFNNGGSSGINNWNTSKVTTIWYMFRYSYFNQPIGNWDMGNCTDMEGAFTAAWNFNQFIGNWNTSKVTRMSLMFASDGVNNNLPYNQSMAGWNISAVTTFTNFMFGKNSSNFSPNNFSATLCGWVNTAPSSLSINFGSAQYCNTGSTCFNTLDITKAWSIASGGSTATCF